MVKALFPCVDIYQEKELLRGKFTDQNMMVSSSNPNPYTTDDLTLRKDRDRDLY